MKKLLAVFLAVCLLTGLGSAFALDAGEARAVIGSDLTDEQVETVYGSFGIRRGDVPEMQVTNEEERQYLDGLVDSAVIGTRSISCVYIEILPAGSGLDVSTNNITWCSKEMYINALVTAGIDDAKVIVSAPWAVSGTAGLTGIYKAYEDISGQELDEIAKLAGTQELVITAELADQIGNYDAVTIVNELKLLLNETKDMTDEELRAQIREIANQYNVNLTDGQIDQLISLCRSLEGLSADELTEKVESVQNTIQKLATAQQTASKVVETIKNIFQSIGNFFTNLFSKF